MASSHSTSTISQAATKSSGSSRARDGAPGMFAASSPRKCRFRANQTDEFRRPNYLFAGVEGISRAKEQATHLVRTKVGPQLPTQGQDPGAIGRGPTDAVIPKGLPADTAILVAGGSRFKFLG